MPTPNGVSELTTDRSPELSNAIPLGEFRLASPLTMAELNVTAGVGLPLAVKLALENWTTVPGELALLDQRLPVLSNASAHGPWMEPLPSSDSIMLGVRVTLPLAVGSVDALNSKIVVVPLLAIHRSPLESKAIPSAPLKAGVDLIVIFGITFAPDAINCVGVNSNTALAPLSLTHRSPLLSHAACCGKAKALELMVMFGITLDPDWMPESCEDVNSYSAGCTLPPVPMFPPSMTHKSADVSKITPCGAAKAVLFTVNDG